VAVLQLLHQLMNSAQAYELAQLLGLPTIRRYRDFVRSHVPQIAGGRILEIGCGVGSSRELFADDYTGVDINPNYIDKARRHLSGRFYVMDAASLPFAPNSFDDAVCIATAHHLSDSELAGMVSSAVAIAQRLHIIDAILPLSSKALLKRTWFQMDRGRFFRTFDQLRELVGRNARIECDDTVEGPLHDVCYIRASRLECGSRHPAAANGRASPG
jgi:SAM-dependent methyltransferase